MTPVCNLFTKTPEKGWPVGVVLQSVHGRHGGRGSKGNSEEGPPKERVPHHGELQVGDTMPSLKLHAAVALS